MEGTVFIIRLRFSSHRTPYYQYSPLATASIPDETLYIHTTLMEWFFNVLHLLYPIAWRSTTLFSRM